MLNQSPQDSGSTWTALHNGTQRCMSLLRWRPSSNLGHHLVPHVFVIIDDLQLITIFRNKHRLIVDCTLTVGDSSELDGWVDVDTETDRGSEEQSEWDACQDQWHWGEDYWAGEEEGQGTRLVTKTKSLTHSDICTLKCNKLLLRNIHWDF